jgi:hypothetical protein
MAHFAEIDKKNVVVRVVVVPNEQEHRGEEYLAVDLGLGGRWVQTSYNATVRKNYAAVGYTYDEARDAFVPPKSYESWVFNEEVCRWQPPIPYPTDGGAYIWNEEATAWVRMGTRTKEPA